MIVGETLFFGSPKKRVSVTPASRAGWGPAPNHLPKRKAGVGNSLPASALRLIVGKADSLHPLSLRGAQRCGNLLALTAKKPEIASLRSQ